MDHSADPDSERPERVSRLKGFVRALISARPPGEPYSGGPYRYPNLFHIVLNPNQQATLIKGFSVLPDHVFEIPDFLEFKSREADFATQPEEGFMDYLARHAVV